MNMDNLIKPNRAKFNKKINYNHLTLYYISYISLSSGMTTVMKP